MKNSLRASVPQIKTPCGNLYITIARDEGGEIEHVFGNGAKSGTCARCVIEALARMTALALRKKRPTIADIIKTNKGIRCNDDAELTFSCPHAFALALERDEAAQVKSDG